MKSAPTAPRVHGSAGRSRLLGVASTFVLPALLFYAGLLMWPLVLENNHWALALIGAFLMSPLIAIVAAIRLHSRSFWWAIGATLAFQFAVEAILDLWRR